MSDALDETRAYWDLHAQRDPLWAILSDTAKRDGKWGVARFFQSGASEIASLLYELDAQEFAAARGSAMDFGCGVGRLTQALAPHFERVVGVDVSPSMIRLASRLNPSPDRVSYICNQAPDLQVFGDRSFDFIVSSIVLQHLPPDLAGSYIREFLRLLTPSGIAVFQLPSHHRRAGNRPLESIANPMPEEAYRASLLVSGMPRLVAPETQVTLQVEVTNASLFDWAQRDYGVLGVGNHWRDAAGRMLTRDDGRARLPPRLRAGETCRLPLTITAPAAAGEYQLEIDVAHEGVLWFEDRGSEVVRLTVGVGIDQPPPESSQSPATAKAQTERSAAAARSADTSIVAEAQLDIDRPGEFPMYGLPLDAVVRLIAAGGATLLHIENDRSCGDDWVSYRYFVRAADM
jgi:SAM-dependent methyltransferase